MKRQITDDLQCPSIRVWRRSRRIPSVQLALQVRITLLFGYSTFLSIVLTHIIAAASIVYGNILIVLIANLKPNSNSRQMGMLKASVFLTRQPLTLLPVEA